MKNYILTVFFFVFSSVLYSQYNKNLVFFDSQMNIINPAYAGYQGDTSFSLISRNQWLSVDDAPKNSIFSFSSARENNVGLGASIFSKNTFVDKLNEFNIDFSYKLKLSEKTNLFFGLKGVLEFFKSDPSFLSNDTNYNDPALSSISIFSPNFGLGFLLNSEKYWFSLSLPKLFQTEINNIYSFDSSVITYIGTGIKIPLNDSFVMKPTILYRDMKDLKSIFDLSYLINYKNIIDFGVTYRTNGSVVFLTKLSVKGFDFGYGFETFRNNSIGGLNLNTHEFFINFSLNKKNTEIEPAE
ncbi:MAG: PorP/SprF family type IX secretion system membrane protein [Cytophagales bacterium]|jgi:type IX secretion system PorP/SprF family membrane protein|tara:strand:- start:214 stop:1107 length:894 start_codon:yes stop_codon:yes gene_type:complete